MKHFLILALLSSVIVLQQTHINFGMIDQVQDAAYTYSWTHGNTVECRLYDGQYLPEIKFRHTLNYMLTQGPSINDFSDCRDKAFIDSIEYSDRSLILSTTALSEESRQHWTSHAE